MSTRHGIALLAALAFLPGGAFAQMGGADEIAMVREAAMLEGAGKLIEAEAVLVDVVERRPTSTPALLALERVLRQQGRVVDLVAHAERAVADEPGSALLNQLLLRTYSWLDREDAIEAGADAWMKATPDVETPYREVARTWEARGDYQRARAALEMGRDRVGDADALALELGSLYAALGDASLAAREWERAIGPTAGSVNQVRRQLRTLPDGGAAIIPELVDRLAQDPATPERLSAAVDLAVAAGLEGIALTLADRLVTHLEAEQRDRLLLDLARRADGAGLRRVAYWAYGQLVARGYADALPVVHARYGELTSELGVAGASGVEIHASATGDEHASSQPQDAAVRIQILASQDPSAALDALREFRDAHRESAAVDGLAAAVAESLVAEDRLVEAEAALSGVRGPRSAVVRGRLALSRGDIQEARMAYLSAASGLRGAEATQLLSLAALLGRTSDDGARLIGGAMTAVAAGDPGAALDGLTAELERFAPAERPGLIEFAAALADANELHGDARELRRSLVADHPRAAEAPAALLSLARSVRTEAPDEARELLERLIIEYPRSALVPQARRELEQVGRRGNESPTDHRSGR